MEELWDLLLAHHLPCIIDRDAAPSGSPWNKATCSSDGRIIPILMEKNIANNDERD